MKDRAGLPHLIAVNLVGDDRQQIHEEANSELLVAREVILDDLRAEPPHRGARGAVRAGRARQTGQRAELADQRRRVEAKQIVAGTIEDDLPGGQEVQLGGLLSDVEQRLGRVHGDAREQPTQL